MLPQEHRHCLFVNVGINLIQGNNYTDLKYRVVEFCLVCNRDANLEDWL